ITHTLVIEGEGTGHTAVAYATKLRWAAGATGIRIQRYDTSGAAAVDNVTTHIGADGTILRSIALFGGYAGAEGEYHGVHAKARVTLEDVHIDNFQGDGIYSNAVAGGGAPNEGNANSCQIFRVSLNNNRNGLFIDG